MTRYRPAAALCFGALMLGCGSGLVRLDAKRVRGVRVVLAGGGETVCPTGATPEVVAIVAYDDGQALETRTPTNPGGKLRPRELAWTAEVGTVEENGVLQLPRDLLPWHDRAFVVRASVPKRPEMTAELRVTPRFDCGGVADVSGLDGDAGSSGGDGEAGGPGPRVEVALAYVETTLNGRLVLVRVRDRDLGRWEYFLVDPRAGKRLVISADGGDGGGGADGGHGSAGSRGTRGADGASGGPCEDGRDGAPGSNGQDGSDGQPGGRGGDGGNGGSVTVLYPVAFPELAQAVGISVEGARAAAAGRAARVARVAAVALAATAAPPGRRRIPAARAPPRQAVKGARARRAATAATGSPGRPVAPAAAARSRSAPAASRRCSDSSSGAAGRSCATSRLPVPIGDPTLAPVRWPQRLISMDLNSARSPFRKTLESRSPMPGTLSGSCGDWVLLLPVRPSVYCHMTIC
jgi:hypothetical protein